MSCIDSISALYAPDQHCADFLLTPARVCDHLWEEITSELHGNHYCFFDVVKRVVYFVAFFALAPFALLLGSLALTLKSCVPITAQPAEREVLSQETAPSVSLVEQAKNKFKELVDRLDDTFIPQHVIYDERGNILVLGKQRDREGITERYHKHYEQSLFVARPEGVMMEYSGFKAEVDDHEYPYSLLIKNDARESSGVMARCVAWQDYWGDAFPLDLGAETSQGIGRKMPYAEMRKIVEEKYRLGIGKLESIIPRDLIALIIEYLLSLECKYQSKTTTLIDRTGGAISVYRSGVLCRCDEKGPYGLGVYGQYISHIGMQYSRMFGWCSKCNPELEIIAEFSQIPGVIKLTYYNRNKPQNKTLMAIDLSPHLSWRQDGSNHTPQFSLHGFFFRPEPLSRGEALEKLRYFMQERRDFEVAQTETAFFAPRFNIITIRGLQLSKREQVVYYLCWSMQEFGVARERNFNFLENPFTIEFDQERNCYIDGEKAVSITYEEIIANTANPCKRANE